jgi:hypothetical protein
VDRTGIGDKRLAEMTPGREKDVEKCFQHGGTQVQDQVQKTLNLNL